MIHKKGAERVVGWVFIGMLSRKEHHEICSICLMLLWSSYKSTIELWLHVMLKDRDIVTLSPAISPSVHAASVRSLNVHGIISLQPACHSWLLWTHQIAWTRCSSPTGHWHCRGRAGSPGLGYFWKHRWSRWLQRALCVWIYGDGMLLLLWAHWLVAS